MRLQYNLFRAKTVCFYFQQTNKQQSATIKINSIIIVKKLSFSENKNDKKKFYDEKILIEVRVVHQKINSFARKAL